MAITINSSPGNYQSFHEDLWFVATSTNTAQTSFKYVFDVYVNSNLVARIKSFPQPTTSKGIFNVANILKNYWSSYFQPSGSPTLFTSVSSGIRLNYEVKFGEEYGGTLYTNLATSTGNAYNYYPSPLNGASAYNGTWYDDYKGLLLTQRDQLNFTTRLNSRSFVSFLNSVENTSKNWSFQITRYNSGTATTSSMGAGVNVTDFALLDISPTAINNYLGTTFITSATSHYLLESYENNAAQWSLVVYILCEPRYTPIPIHFLNSLGGYDTMNFQLVNRQSRAIERKSFDQIGWQYDSNQMKRVNSYNIFNGGQIPFATTQNITYKLTSDWLNLTEYNWIKDLIASPEAYMQEGDYYLPVKVTTSNWTEKKRYADKQYNLELDIEVGQIQSQYR